MTMEGEDMKEGKVMSRKRILLFPLPFQGHVTPMLNLANILLLHSNAFSITIIHTRYNSLDPTHFPHLTFHFLEDGLPQNARLTSTDLTTILSAIQTNCVKPFQDCLSHILSAALLDHQPVACLISDPMYAFAASVAQTFNLPTIVLRTGGISAFLLYDALPSLRQNNAYYPLPLQEGELEEAVEGLPPLKVKDLPAEVQHGILATTVKETKTSQGVICNTFEELEHSAIATIRQTQMLPCPFFPIGPMHKYSQGTPAPTLLTPDHTCISWLNTQAPKSVIYVSFGSVAVISETEFLEMAWGLANSRQPFLWVVRPGLSQDLELSQDYARVVGERGKIVKWAPQVEVLSHPAVGGFWTHCGWNSTVESICEGVPMLCLPFFADQAINARYVCDSWKIGLRLEKKTRENIQNAVTKLMVEEESGEMRSRMAALKEKAHLCLQKDGSSYESLTRLTTYLSSL